MDKRVPSAAEAVADIGSGSSLAVGGFGMCGVPVVLIDALIHGPATELEIVSNNCGAEGFGLARLLHQHRIRRVVASYFGDNKEFARQYLAGEIEVEVTPQGTLAERLRAAGAGIPAFFTPTGAHTLVAEGGMPWRHDVGGGVALASPSKEVRVFGGRAHVLEEALHTDFALVRAAKGDRHGNLVFHASARNFNPLCAMAADVAIAEVEEFVEPGEIHPDEVHLPGIFIERVVPLTPRQVTEKQIERRVVRASGEAG
jgi:3-oxoacid CoA-transferase subunit A